MRSRIGWDVAGVFTDNDVSAYSGRKRPAYQALMEHVSAGGVDAIVAWHPDRLHRSPLELEQFIDLVNAKGTKVATVNAGEYDLTTASGRMTARVVGAVARGESEQKAERIRRKALQIAREGRVGGGGTRPFGFESDRVTVNESEAVLIRDAAVRVLSGASLGSVARDWQQRGITTPAGKKWRTTPLRRMLQSPRIAGLREHQGEVIGDATWPAIIDPNDRERLAALFARNAAKQRRPPRHYFLTGLLYCSDCGHTMVARPRGDGTRTYVCASGPNFSGCGKRRAKADTIEAFIEERILATLADPRITQALAAAHHTDDGVDVSAELAQLAQRREELVVRR